MTQQLPKYFPPVFLPKIYFWFGKKKFLMQNIKFLSDIKLHFLVYLKKLSWAKK